MFFFIDNERGIKYCFYITFRSRIRSSHNRLHISRRRNRLHIMMKRNRLHLRRRRNRFGIRRRHNRRRRDLRRWNRWFRNRRFHKMLPDRRWHSLRQNFQFLNALLNFCVVRFCGIENVDELIDNIKITYNYQVACN